MKFDYYYQNQVKQFQFIMIPKAMFGSREFEGLSYAAKLLYGLLRDKCTLSAKNNWVDEENRVYIIFTIKDIAAELLTSEKMSVQYLSELESFGLVEKKRRGLGMPNLLYVKNFVIDEEKMNGNDEQSKNGRNVNSRTSQKVNSGFADSLVQDFPDTPMNNTNNNQTDIIQTDANHTEPYGRDKFGRQNTMEKIVNNHIEYETLIECHALDRGIINGIRDLIAEVLLSEDETILIAKQEMPACIVKSKFLKIKMEHVEYVIDWIKKHPVQMQNPKKYLMTLLYNSFVTMDAYYTSCFSENYAS